MNVPASIESMDSMTNVCIISFTDLVVIKFLYFFVVNVMFVADKSIYLLYIYVAHIFCHII